MTGDEKPDGIAMLIDRAGRATRGLQFMDGLSPAQWEALRYVSRANLHSRNPSALAAFLGTTKGTVSQTLIALEGKGYLRRERRARDRRAVRLEITPAGRALLRKDPLRRIEALVVEVLSPELRAALADGLERLLDDLGKNGDGRAFGVCVRCDLFGVREAAVGETEEACLSPRCGLTDEPIAEGETDCLCANYCSEDAAG